MKKIIWCMDLKWTYHEATGYYKHGTFLLHRIVWEQNNGPIPKNKIVHHKNEDKTDNDISNLELLTRAEHARLHLKGRVFTEEHKAKISASKMGHTVSNEQRQQMREAKLGTKASDVTKKKMSESSKGNTRGKSNKGKIHSEETKQKYREAALRRPPMSQETRDKISATKKKQAIERKEVV